ncbi:MAG TPA: radical SAM protein [Bryobacteraceae bacterium]|nr:radical SAM protein [Bryobacteraceae bacterium]
MRAWGRILQGRAPSLSIEITRECPLRCPGCYAYEDAHLGGLITLRELRDYKGEPLVKGILEVADRLKPLHLSLVGGDPMVRYRELEVLVPELLKRGIHVQLVSSGFRVFPQSWANLENFSLTISIDGLQPDHDERRKPATYDRILKNIQGQRIIVHCTIVAKMMERPGYLEEFVQFWSARDEVKKIWFSIFTPQRGADLPEMLTPAQRRQAHDELLLLSKAYAKVDMPAGMIKEFLNPPQSPEQCVFAQTTETISADLTTRITPCQFGGDPDCSQCGCIASMGLAAVANYKLGGFVPVGAIFRTSAKIGSAVKARRNNGPKALAQVSAAGD